MEKVIEQAKPKEEQDMEEYTLALSYGKDSLACLGAIKLLSLPLTRIVHAEIWFDDNIPADLPPMVEFKSKADWIIYQQYGIKVEHIKAPVTYKQIFYRKVGEKARILRDQLGSNYIYGFPLNTSAWCVGKLKQAALKEADKQSGTRYWGIAADEPKRIERHKDKPGVVLPLVLAGWDEAYCRSWCEKRDLLSPIYTNSTRGGCWFCHNQSTGQLRQLRKNYPHLWNKLLKLDADSPIPFKASGHTVKDYDDRFCLEDMGIIDPTDKWLWGYLDNIPIQLKI